MKEIVHSHSHRSLFIPLVVAGVALAARSVAAAEGDVAQPTADAATEAVPPDASVPAEEQASAAVPSPPESRAAVTAEVPPAVVPANPTLDVLVVAPRPPRSASEVTRERALLQAAPHRSADELLYVVPGVFITQHSGEGKAYQIFYRGFDAVHGQDLEIWAGGAPVNDVSNLHGQGYADLHFLPREVVKQVTASPGTYDPRQGDFAVAGSMRFDLGYDQPGITAKADFGSFDSHRYFLAYRPRDASDGNFAAVEFSGTRGFGPSRAAQRASAVAQLERALDGGATLRVMASAYTGRFASAGVLRLADIESGAVDRYATYDPTQGGASARTQVVAELRQREDRSDRALSTYLVLRSLRLRQNFTGYLVDPNGDSEQQLNDAFMVGATGHYRVRVPIVSERDSVEAGFFARTDWIDQSQKRLAVVDNRVTADEVDARVRGQDVAGYLDVGLHPWSRLTLRGGLRLDGLGYAAQDSGAQAGGQTRSSQGLSVAKRGTADVRLVSGLRAVLSYGEGFRSPQARSLAEGETTPFTRVTSYEVGLRHAASWGTSSLALYQTSLSDDLVFDQATARNERVPATRRTGGSLDVTATPTRWLVAAASATFTRAVFTASDQDHQAGDLVPYAPQWVVRGDVAVTPRLGTVRGRALEGRLGTGLSLMARRPLPYGQWGHDILLVDGSASLRAGPVQVGLEAFNLLGARWYDGEFVFASRWDPTQAAALVPQRHVTVGAPRTVLLSMAVFL
jgi:iron complex outermembrane receptor protein